MVHCLVSTVMAKYCQGDWNVKNLVIHNQIHFKAKSFLKTTQSSQSFILFILFDFIMTQFHYLYNKHK